MQWSVLLCVCVKKGCNLWHINKYDETEWHKLGRKQGLFTCWILAECLLYHQMLLELWETLPFVLRNLAFCFGIMRNLAFCLLCHQMLLELWDGCSMLKSVEHWRMLSLPWFVSIYRDLPWFPSIYHCLPQFTLEYRALNGVNKWQNLCCDNLDKRFSS